MTVGKHTQSIGGQADEVVADLITCDPAPIQSNPVHAVTRDYVAFPRCSAADVVTRGRTPDRDTVVGIPQRTTPVGINTDVVAQDEVVLRCEIFKSNAITPIA